MQEMLTELTFQHNDFTEALITLEILNIQNIINFYEYILPTNDQ